MAMLQCLTKNTHSGDVIYLSIAAARKLCANLGIPKDDFEEVIYRYRESMAQLRASNPMAWD